MRVLPFLAKEQDVNFQNKLILDSCIDQPASSQLHLKLSSFIRYLLSIYSALSAEIITVNKTTSAFGEHEFFMKKKKKLEVHLLVQQPIPLRSICPHSTPADLWFGFCLIFNFKMHYRLFTTIKSNSLSVLEPLSKQVIILGFWMFIFVSDSSIQIKSILN